MFTGIVQAVGRVAEVMGDSLSIQVAGDFLQDPVIIGESIAVNGVCLTVVTFGPDGLLRFDVSPETFARSALQCLRTGSRINLERAMRVSDRFGGHIVQGHVDATGSLVSKRAEGEFTVFRFSAPTMYDRYLIDKGSIALDGISLTVVSPEAGAFDVWIVPHTLENTNMGDLKIGDPVNLEFDVIAKHVEKLLTSGVHR
jgi:riboflavin synthase